MAVCNDSRQTRELIRLLGDGLPGFESVEIQEPITDLLQTAREQVRRETQVPVMIVGLEHAVPGDVDDHPLLRTLNLERARWPDELPRPVVLWVPEYLLALLGRQSADFLDWRSGTFLFTEGIAGQEVRRFDGEAWEWGLAGNLSVEERRERVEELRSRLAATSDSLDPVVRSARARWLHELGLHLEFLGDLEEAKDSYEQVCQLLMDLGRNADLAPACHQLGRIAEQQNLLDEAEVLYQESLRLDEEAGDRAGVATSCHQLGFLAYRRGDMDEAEKWSLKAMAIAEELGLEDSLARSHHNLGILAEEQGSLSEAEAHYLKALALRSGGRNEITRARTISQIGGLRTLQGRVDEAVEWNLESLAIRERFDRRRMEIDLQWLRRQLDLLGVERFVALVERHWGSERATRLMDQLESRASVEGG